jgi:hypothetical protein
MSEKFTPKGRPIALTDEDAIVDPGAVELAVQRVRSVRLRSLLKAKLKKRRATRAG